MSSGSATYAVLLTEGAEQDLEATYDHIAAVDCPANATFVAATRKNWWASASRSIAKPLSSHTE